MTTSTVNFQGYTFTVQSEDIDGESRTFTVTLDGKAIVSDIADATSHAEVVEYLDTTPMAQAVKAELAEDDDDGGDYYRQVCSDYYTDRI